MNTKKVYQQINIEKVAESKGYKCNTEESLFEICIKYDKNLNVPLMEYLETKISLVQLERLKRDNIPSEKVITNGIALYEIIYNHLKNGGKVIIE